MYSFNSANTRVGGADAYLRQNSEFSKGRARPRMERLHSKLIFCLVIGIAMVHHDPPGKFKGFAAQQVDLSRKECDSFLGGRGQGALGKKDAVLDFNGGVKHPGTSQNLEQRWSGLSLLRAGLQGQSSLRRSRLEELEVFSVVLCQRLWSQYLSRVRLIGLVLFQLISTSIK